MNFESFYKYRPLYQLGARSKQIPHPFTQSIFTRAEIFYCAPKDINDPFDCNLKLHFDNSTDGEWLKYYDKLIVEYPENKAKLEIIKAQKPWRTNPQFSANIVDKLRDDFYNKSSMFCLSRKANSIPMFSYYSDSHRGIAIEFRFCPNELPCGIPCGDLSDSRDLYGGKITFRDVIYTPEFPELNYHRLYNNRLFNPLQVVNNLLFTKYHEWQHEKEFRIFRKEIPPGLVKFDKKSLTKIIFGCKTTQVDVDLVKTWLKGWPYSVILSRAETARDKFELRIHYCPVKFEPIMRLTR